MYTFKMPNYQKYWQKAKMTKNDEKLAKNQQISAIHNGKNNTVH